MIMIMMGDYLSRMKE